MKIRILFCLILTALSILGLSQETAHYRVEKPLQILDAAIDNKRFDLSGICSKDGKWWVVADKPWNHFLYRIDTLNNRALLDTKTDVSSPGKLDMEGVDYGGESFFFCDERHSRVFQYHRGEVHRLSLDWGAINFDSWRNKGLEGIAFDPGNQMIYLGKERQPQKFFKVPASGGKIQEILKEVTAGHDFQVADLKYDSSYLYVLDRKNYRVLKVNVPAQSLKAVLDYGNVMNHKGEKFYENSRYPMAEALMFEHNRLIIGLDNNGEQLNKKNKWVKRSKLEGNNPVIIIFERPQHF
ncbi:MAG: SdiA-regulated domain-containing protein [Bacteroidales bacterium]|nr:SdiA-regulated domain-containing protein [Bacteroidales bacterium]MCF8338254.1 SdiA-regulated domain-containing protein [Bacteroidales bacterium]